MTDSTRSHLPASLPDLGPAAPTPPIALSGDGDTVSARLDQRAVEVPDAVLTQLRSACASVTTDAATNAESSRDWWPLAMTWALDNQVAGLAGAVARPSHADQIPAILRICNDARIPVTAAAGRSGVCGSSVPLYGGVVLDLCDLDGIVSVDDTSLTADVRAGMFGDHFEHQLRTTYGLTCGHWPQSVTLSTVGGWLACRGAGQLSTRYGKIEDMVIGLDVVLADGTTLHTGGNARQSSGPDLNQLFVGSEGTLGIITGARLRLHPAPVHERRAAYGFETFEHGLEVCRRILRRGATPAVLRLYDAVEANRSYQTGELAVLLVLDEGEPALVDTTVELIEEECEEGLALDVDLVERWMQHRNDVSQLEQLIGGGLVVDTMEVTGPWAALPDIYAAGGRGHQGGARHAGGIRPPEPRLPRRRLSLLHLRRQARPGRQGRALPRRVGRGHQGRARTGRVAQPPPRRRHQPGPVHDRGARRRPTGCWRR